MDGATGFRDRFRRAIDASPYRASLRQLSLAADQSVNRANNIIHDDRLDVSKVGPGLFTMARFADVLNVSLDYLAGRTAEIAGFSDFERDLAVRTLSDTAAQTHDHTQTPTPQSLARLYAKSGARIEAFVSALPYCDLYEPVADETSNLTVRSLGKKSLAALTMGTDNPAVLQGALDRVGDRELIDKVLFDHRLVQEKGVLTTVETLDVQMPNLPKKVKMDYIRTLVSLTDAEGQGYTLLHASLIS